MLNRSMALFAVCISVVMYLGGRSEAASRASFQHNDLAQTPLEAARNDVRHGYEKCTIYAAEKRVDCSKRHLTSVPNDLPPDTLSLDLTENRIHTVWNDSFTRYRQLTSLFLNFNSLSRIEQAAIKPLTKLITLVLGFNRYLRLSNEKLEWPKHLQDIDISACGLTSIPSDIVKIPSLITLYLMRNNLTSINFTDCKMQENGSVDLSDNSFHSLNPETFTFDCHCDFLDISSNPVQSIVPDVIASLRVRHLSFGGDNISSTTWTHFLKGVSNSSIQVLDLLINGINRIPSDFFDALKDYPLNELHLNLNDRLQLDPYVFRNLTKVFSLHLNGHGIEELRPRYFSGMTGLRELNLGFNSIRSINPNSHFWDVNLTKLDLSDNKLVQITPYSMFGLKSLTLFDLEKNTKLHYVHLQSNARVGTLNFAGTKMFSFLIQMPKLISLTLKSTYFNPGCLSPGKTFKYTPSLQVLNMADSSIHSHDLWSDILNMSLFQGLHSLQSLDLKENSFQELPSGVFQDLWSLKKIDLSTCKIRSIKSGALNRLKSLQTLFLQNNHIQNFQPALLDDLPKLSIFMARSNKLNSLEKNLFKHNSWLTHITLSDNQLAGFNKSTFDPVRLSLESIDISGNFLVCDCQIRWLVDWFHGSLQIQNANETICSTVSATLEPFQGKPLMGFDPKWLCDSNATLFSGITVCGLALLVILLLMYHNRWRLKYKLFLLKLALLGYIEIQDDRVPEDFDFDLNVIFTDEGEEWVQRRLRPFVAEGCPHLDRNVFGDEDLFLGMHVLDAVLHAVENSFKTLILISAAAVNDQWFMTKFRIALNHVNDSQTENVILIFLEDVEDEELPFLVRLFLSDHGSYLQWTNDDDGQKYFWKELKKYLAVNRMIDRRIPVE